ncbi:MAG: hypothetical protein PWR31_942 [Bacillota bacterium]|nr:hypothetical protein [Bacillota bacterium]
MGALAEEQADCDTTDVVGYAVGGSLRRARPAAKVMASGGAKLCSSYSRAW